MQKTSVKSFFFRYSFPYILIFFGMVSLCFLLERHDADIIVAMLEAFFMLYTFGAYIWTRNEPITINVVVRWSTLLYIMLSYFYAVTYKERNVLDFLLIYKSFVYIFFLTFLTGKKLLTYKATNNLFVVLIAIFILKYIFQIVISHNNRPLVYMENNFELMFLYALYLIRYSANKDKYLQLLGLVGLITILSLSRSSLLMYSVLVLFVIYDSFKKTRVFIIPGAIVILGGIIFYIFSQRSQNLEEIDRFRFMLVWWTNVRDWNFLQWMVGAERITPLNAYSCMKLSYFGNLVSNNHDGTCYSVILHSFVFRVLYDHGAVGFIVIILSCYMLLVKSKLRKDVILVFMAIVLLNGLSVSSFNNLFFAISMVFLMTTNLKFLKEKDEDEEEEETIIPLNSGQSLVPAFK